MNFDNAFQHVLKHEGGYAHHPLDPGGCHQHGHHRGRRSPCRLQGSEDPTAFIYDWPFEQIQLLSDLQFRDKLERTLLTERLEQRKSMFVLKALQQKMEAQ